MEKLTPTQKDISQLPIAPYLGSTILSGGPCAKWPNSLFEGRFVIGCDSGYDCALANEVEVNLFVGDFDSVQASVSPHVKSLKFSRDKDKTDLELCLDWACSNELGPSVHVLFGYGWDRLDHLLAQLGLLGNPLYSAKKIVSLWRNSDDTTTIATVVNPLQPHDAFAQSGEYISIIPIGGLATGVSATGLAYELIDQPLSPFTTRAISNEGLGSQFQVRTESGALLVTQVVHNLKPENLT